MLLTLVLGIIFLFIFPPVGLIILGIWLVCAGWNVLKILLEAFIELIKTIINLIKKKIIKVRLKMLK